MVMDSMSTSQSIIQQTNQNLHKRCVCVCLR